MNSELQRRGKQKLEPDLKIRILLLMYREWKNLNNKLCQELSVLWCLMQAFDGVKNALMMMNNVSTFSFTVTLNLLKLQMF